MSIETYLLKLSKLMLVETRQRYRDVIEMQICFTLFLSFFI